MAQTPAAVPQKRAATAKSAPSFEQTAKDADAARTSDRLLEAIALYRKGVAMKPDWAEGWWYLSTLLYEKEQFADARDALRRYVLLDPKNGMAHALLGLCLFQTREFQQALAYLERGEALGYGTEQTRAVAYYHMAMLLTRSEQFERAVQILMRFAERLEDRPAMIEVTGLAALRKPLLPTELPPEDRDIVMMAGRAIWEAGGRRPELALNSFEALIEKYPSAPHVHYLYGSFLLTREPERALKELHKEIEISPAHVPALVQTAFEYLKQGDPEKGAPLAERAVRVDPASFVAHSMYGRILVELGELEKGVGELELAKKIAPDSAQTRFALGSAYRRMGRTKEAQAELAEFERLKKIIDEQMGRAPARPQ